MAHARISASLPPDIDPTKAAIAFGKRALPKLNEELQSPELLTQQQALMALCDLVHDPENVYQAIELGFLDNLKTLLLHHDSTVRQKTTEILYIMAMHNVGRQGLLKNEVLSALAELLDDPVDICRKNTHQIFEIMAKLPEGGEFKIKKPNLDILQGTMKKFAFSAILFRYCLLLDEIVKWTWWQCTASLINLRTVKIDANLIARFIQVDD
ncbi:PREDICTED: rhabdoid tumor deletion region protein 1 [Chlamydotis macqueenii]|uniref:rhabdoid tumor deletion region protein 1 n=1 Tax=Chlamydotis macqueenii TaxID=187382 RepID=UPI0005296385|nr:PREDICTED: rhabdoid tumor deletion region protein 1 [Chlamydotis macqueenii]